VDLIGTHGSRWIIKEAHWLVSRGFTANLFTSTDEMPQSCSCTYLGRPAREIQMLDAPSSPFKALSKGRRERESLESLLFSVALATHLAAARMWRRTICS